MSAFLRHCFFLCIVRPIVLFVLGLNVRHRERLPRTGPAIIVANHNSHLDTMVLITLFPVRMLKRLKPIAAADYFLKNKLLAWFSLNVIGIVPLRRNAPTRDEALNPMQECSQELEKGNIVILFPEGTRGEPEQLGQFKKGIERLARKHPTVPIVPVFLHGLGKALPRGDFVLIPFFCDVFIGAPFFIEGDRAQFMNDLSERMRALADEGNFASWE